MTDLETGCTDLIIPALGPAHSLDRLFNLCDSEPTSSTLRIRFCFVRAALKEEKLSRLVDPCAKTGSSASG
jgi:hypothetical protein